MSPAVVQPPVIATKPVIISGPKSSEPKSPLSSPLRYKQSSAPDEKEPPESAVRSTIAQKDEEPPKKLEPLPRREPTPEPKREPTVEPKRDPIEPKQELILETKQETSQLPLIEMDTFQQILELDEEPDYEFTQTMVDAYFEQADDTFKKMDESLKNKDLADLAALGHFLKGSSAALGLARVQATCEIIQHRGHKRDEDADKDLTDVEALTIIEGLLARVRAEYDEAEAWLKKWCEEHSA